MHPVTSLLFPSVFFSFSLFAQPESTFCPRVRSEKKQASSEKFFIFPREQAAKIWKKVLLLYGLLTPLHIPFQLAWFLTHPLYRMRSTAFLFFTHVLPLQKSPLSYLNSPFFPCVPVLCLCQWCTRLFLPSVPRHICHYIPLARSPRG